MSDAWPEFSMTCDICRDLGRKGPATRVVVCRESPEESEERYAVCDDHEEDMEMELDTGELVEFASWQR